MANSVIIKIKRQNTPNSKPYWEEFELPYKSGRNVTSALMEIARSTEIMIGSPLVRWSV